MTEPSLYVGNPLRLQGPRRLPAWESEGAMRHFLATPEHTDAARHMDKWASGGQLQRFFSTPPPVSGRRAWRELRTEAVVHHHPVPPAPPSAMAALDAPTHTVHPGRGAAPPTGTTAPGLVVSPRAPATSDGEDRTSTR